MDKNINQPDFPHTGDAFEKFDKQRVFDGMTSFEIWEHGVLWADRTNPKSAERPAEAPAYSEMYVGGISELDKLKANYADALTELSKASKELQEARQQYNDLGVKFDKQLERWQIRDADELSKRKTLESELQEARALLHEIMLVTIDASLSDTEAIQKIQRLQDASTNLKDR